MLTKEQPTLSVETTPSLETPEKPQSVEPTRSILRNWAETNALKEKSDKDKQQLSEKEKLSRANSGLDWYADNEPISKPITEASPIQTTTKDNILYQISGMPLTPEGGTGAYIYGQYDKNKPTVALVNGMGEPKGFAHLVDEQQAANYNVVMISVDHSKSLKKNVQQIIKQLEEFKQQDIEINELASHSAGNRFTLELLQELGIQNNDLLSGIDVIGLNPKLADEYATGKSTGFIGKILDWVEDVTGGGYDNITRLMDADNPRNNYLKGDLINVRKALGDGKLSFIVATNDPHNPEQTTQAGALFNNVLNHADNVKYITPPTNPHEYLLEN